MAKKSEELKKVDVGTTAIAERPSFIPEGAAGTENITQQDIQIPRLLIAQKMSPEVDKTMTDRFIPDLEPGDMFNGLTKKIIGRGPLEFAVLRADRPRGVEFIPRADGGGIKDPNVPLDDPRMQFGPNGEKPTATKFYDYIIALAPFGTDDLMSFSFKSTGLKVAKQLNALIKLRNAPVYAGIYKLTTVDTKNQHGSFAIPKVENAGWPKDEATMNHLRDLSEAFKNKPVDFDREDDPDDFDPEKIEKDKAAANGTEGM